MFTLMIARNLWRNASHRRVINAIGFLACALMLAYAYYLQHVEGLMPCPLCIIERTAMAILGVLFLSAAVHHPRRRRGARFYSAMITVVAGISALTAGYHVWLQHQPAEGPAFCLPPLAYLLESFPLTEAVSILLQSPGGCSAVHWTLLGLSIPAWTLVAFTGLGLVGSVRNWPRGCR